MSDIYYVESNVDSDSGTPAGSSAEYYLLPSRPDNSYRENHKNNCPGESAAVSIPEYLEITAYGERFRAFANCLSENSNDTAIASKFNLPQMFPSRSAAELDAVGLWKHYGDDDHSTNGNDSSNGNANGASSASASSSRPPPFLSVVPLIQNFGNWIDKKCTNESPPFVSRREMGLPPLPSRWVKSENNQLASVSPSGYEVSFEYDSKLPVHETVTVRTDHPVPPLCGIYYFEVEITSQGANDFLGIGLCDEDVSLAKVPGLDSKSWGYHSDDGRITACKGTAKQYGPKFGQGDVIGCAINFKKNSVFYTKNGLPLGAAFQDVKGILYPCVGMKKGMSVYTNFGQDEFRFDIEKYVKDQKKTVLNLIANQPLNGLFGEDREISDFIKDLVSQYFNHVGFSETAKAFKQERDLEERALVSEPNGSEMDISEPDDMNDRVSIDVQNRHRIRKLVLAGDIDAALKLLKVFYPQVLENNSLILFKLRCRKFIELIRKSIPGNEDVEMTDGDVPSSSSEETDTPLSIAIDYGQKLRQDYKNDDRLFVVEHLPKVFSLLAYEDPSTSREFSYLLDQEELVPLAEELNSALLVSQGKPSVPALQKLAQQAIQLTWELSDQGYTRANLLNVDKDFLEVTRSQ